MAIILTASGIRYMPDSLILQVMPSGATGLRAPKIPCLVGTCLISVGSSFAFFRAKHGIGWIPGMTIGFLLFLLIYAFNQI